MDTFNEVLTKNPIIIDNGSGTIKIGFGGEENPRIMCPTYVGRPKYKEVLPVKHNLDYYVGNFNQESRGLLKLKYPMNRGQIQNWSDMDLIWKYLFNELKVAQKEYPVLLTEPAMNPLSNKMQLAQQFFEGYNVPALFIAPQGNLNLFATGKTTGIVLDCGDSMTQITPVFEGYGIQHANQRIDLGGRDVTDYLQLLLRKSGYNFHTSAEYEIVKQIKEKKCVVNVTQTSDEKLLDDRKIKESYQLPDGSTIQLTNEKNRAPEILFSPDKVGLEYPSLPELLTESILKTDIDLRRTLYYEIVFCGGTTLMDSFVERALNEIRKLSPRDVQMRVYVTADRQMYCFRGGAILSSLNTFKSMWIMKKEFEEEGEKILLKKQM